MATVRLAVALLVPCIALVLVLSGYRPAPAAPTTVATLLPAGSETVATVARDCAGRPLDCLTVRELRLQARTAGFRALARSGRRADLLAALAAA